MEEAAPCLISICFDTLFFKQSCIDVLIICWYTKVMWLDLCYLHKNILQTCISRCSFHFSSYYLQFFFFFGKTIEKSRPDRVSLSEARKKKFHVFIFLVSIYQVSLSSWKVISEMMYTQFDSGRQVKSIQTLTQLWIRHFTCSYGTVVTYITSSQFGLPNML